MTLRSIAELAAYGSLALLLILASVAPDGPILAAGSATTSTVERGRALFAVKGCAGCHVHSAVPGGGINLGPDLSSLRDRASRQVAGRDARGYVRQSILDPSAFLASTSSVAMPTLLVSAEELEALVAFLVDR